MKFENEITEKDVNSFYNELLILAKNNRISFGFEREKITLQTESIKMHSNCFELFVKDLEGNTLFDSFKFREYSNKETYEMYIKIREMINKLIKNKPIG